MKAFRAWLLRSRGLFSKAQREREFASEIESHLQMQIDDNLRSGMTPEEARRAALLKLGGVEQTKQAYRERGTMPFLESVWQDLRFAVRQFVKNPGFACTAIFVLALGMGASVAIFAFVDATLLKPLPYWQPQRLVSVTETVEVVPRANLSYADYLDWKSRNDVLTSLDVWNERGYMLATPDGRAVGDGCARQRRLLPHAGRSSLARPRLLSRRRPAQRTSLRDPELRNLAEVFRWSDRM